MVMLKLGQLYYETEEFVKAQECYAGVIGLIDKERDDYKAIDERSKILDELLPFAKAVELQDSLQMMAKLDSVARMKKIEEMIEELKKIPEIVEAHFTTGSYSVIVKLYARDNEHLMTLLNEHIQEIPGVTNTETMISLDQSIKKELPITID